MAKHKVLMSLPPRQIKRADAKFEVQQDGKMFGTLEISQGSIVWFAPYTKYGMKMSWQRFHEIMEQHASRVEER